MFRYSFFLLFESNDLWGIRSNTNADEIHRTLTLHCVRCRKSCRRWCAVFWLQTREFRPNNMYTWVSFFTGSEGSSLSGIHCHRGASSRNARRLSVGLRFSLARAPTLLCTFAAPSSRPWLRLPSFHRRGRKPLADTQFLFLPMPRRILLQDDPDAAEKKTRVHVFFLSQIRSISLYQCYRKSKISRRGRQSKDIILGVMLVRWDLVTQRGAKRWSSLHCWPTRPKMTQFRIRPNLPVSL